MGQPPLASERSPEGGISARRLFGFDRSGPPPPETLPGAPLNPWTVPNAICYARLALIPVFLYLAYRTDDGRSAAAAILWAVLAWADYLDGIAARLTGQYSRLGTLLDPLVDRLLVVSGLAVCWSYELLPRWALAVLAARELFMLVLARYGLRRGLDLHINWYGRLGVWWVLAAPFWAMVGVDFLAKLGLYVGLVLTLAATAAYLRDGIVQMRARKTSPRPSSSG